MSNRRFPTFFQIDDSRQGGFGNAKLLAEFLQLILFHDVETAVFYKVRDGDG